MQRWKKHLGEIGDVEAFDYPYMRENRKRPDPLPQLIAAHREALAKAQKKKGQLPSPGRRRNRSPSAEGRGGDRRPQ